MDIQIKYDNGQMNIRMDAFFPTSQARLKKLLKVVDLDFEHREEIMQTMQQFFQDKVNELEEKRISSGKKAVEYKQKIADTTAIIESRKHPNGVPLTKDELADIKEQNKHLKAVYAGCMSDFNRSIRQKDLFLKHLEILEQRK
ncbi:hypothetical protein ACPW7J_12975 [Ihubacter sp. rT4E-8]|uniref:hypothetical protein n=1 Tax=Ihubacter sp. rT4E-8 TaxID=3242369 RepID=UPI003CF554C9